LKHSRTLESSADQAALSTLSQLGYSSRPMADSLSRLSAQEVLPGLQRSPYVLTHPLSRDRLNTVENYVSRSATRDAKYPEAWEQKFQRMRAKILAFTAPSRAQREYASQSNAQAFYATAIADYRQGDITGALQKITTMQKTAPDDPYLYDLKGQILFEQGRIGESIAAYQKAVSLAPKNGLLNLTLAKVLLQKNGAEKDALKYLTVARDRKSGV